MSEENLDLMRACDAALAADDLDRWLEYFSPDVEVLPDASVFPEPPMRGRDALIAWMQTARSALRDEKWRSTEVRLAADGRVLNQYVWSGEGATSGLRTSMNVTAILTFRDRQIVQVHLFVDHAAALKAAGLEEWAMSRTNVEITKGVVNAFNRRDIDAFAELTTPDFEWVPVMVAIEGEVFRGREGIETYLGRLDEAWEDYRVAAGEYRDLGDRVLYLGRMVGRGRGSGVPVDTPLGALTDYRDGKCWRLRNFLDHSEALRAAGLAE
ncbi:MAG TPA: nuclear transport factor 2 family protein [Solirubrobacteraceae bacterium]|nr:nuclear transport factor 2 family protein [Solirubrobacteraceae bacterium]